MKCVSYLWRDDRVVVVVACIAIVGDLEVEAAGIGSFAWRCKNKEMCEETFVGEREREREVVKIVV